MKAATAMEEELLKRNTDCVYFLASPLTCKKGIDCEYRHCEISRLNPRDCWYWLAGNCLNPTCAFRHPPLEKYANAPSESSLSSELANKTNIPCYFYFSSICNKGEKCSFMHGPDHNTAARKSGSMSLELKEGFSLDEKTHLGNDNVSSSREVNASRFETVSKAVMDLKFQPKEGIQFPSPKTITLQSPQHIPMAQGEETVALKSDFLLHTDFAQSRSLICTEQSSEEQVNDQVEPEDRWESSPGFDVLVDGESENLGNEDDQEYLLALDRGHRELNNHLSSYDLEDIVKYDPACCDGEVIYEGGIYDSFDFVDNVRIVDDIGNDSGHFSARTWGSLLSRKRKLLRMELATNGRRFVDLREHLRKRRLINGHPVLRSSRRHDSSRLCCHSGERIRRPGIQRMHGRLASEVRKNAIKSHENIGTFFDGLNHRGLLRHSRSNRSMKRKKQRRLSREQLLSEVPRKPVLKERRFSRTSTEFTGPKTLAQIREEKKRTGANRDCPGKFGNSSRMALAHFEGPKPLTEILKDKKRSGSGQECDDS